MELEVIFVWNIVVIMYYISLIIITYFTFSFTTSLFTVQGTVRVTNRLRNLIPSSLFWGGKTAVKDPQAPPLCGLKLACTSHSAIHSFHLLYINQIVKTPTTTSRQPQLQLGLMQLWPFTPHLPTHHQELYSSSSEPARQCKLTQS